VVTSVPLEIGCRQIDGLLAVPVGAALRACVRDWVIVVAAISGRLHPPGPGAVPHGDSFMQFGTDVVQPDAVLGGVGRELAAGYVLAVDACVPSHCCWSS
jgi:hypothetical protein